MRDRVGAPAACGTRQRWILPSQLQVAGFMRALALLLLQAVFVLLHSPGGFCADFSMVAMTDNAPVNTSLYRPLQPPLDVAKYPVAPPELTLEQVHVYIRHGERTPVGVRLADAPANIPRNWQLCNRAREYVASVVGPGQQDEKLKSRKLLERADGTVADGTCLLGELTDVGRQSTYNYGASLRELYINKLGFLPNYLLSDAPTYFRSTNMPRTIESLQQVMHGLYPTDKCHPDVTPPLIVRNGKDENTIGNTYDCPRLEVLLVGFAQAAAAAYNHTLEPLDHKLSKYLDGNPIRVDGKPRASGILDTIRASIAHDVKVPPEFEEKPVMDLIERAVVNEWFSDKTEEVRRLGMGRLLGDLSRKMHNKATQKDKDPLKILVHSTHDTGLAALASTLDVFDDKWPAFTASITFELFKKSQTAAQPTMLQTILSPFRVRPVDEYFVRMRYQNKNMHLPLCADEGKHLAGAPEFCTLNAFMDRIKELTPVDWEAECARGGRTA
ncbi:phosphoglycerate mutase-like protein [Cylindrobasidium torrendii FP15055 ss-10]|uniref:Phosphoglycerate mutase-like protein n=1 Tax=Cylindrobasidium torrendii FP15055 ss-10 TaxID=1314674 RepID=A0A0D7BJY4_9AGAR|nr:phosphoglycerate mutase-like protein [Cylindrobasidium torrendii FP15055 ss-10]